MAARVGGRNRFVSWAVGLLCAGVIGGLFYFAAPLGPSLVEYIGETLRSLDP